MAEESQAQQWRQEGMRMTKDQSENRMTTLVEALANSHQEYWRLAFDRDPPTKLGKPSTPAQIAKLEKGLGHLLPPSYKAFLQLYNGWEGFEGDGKLLGTDDHKATWVKERIGLVDMIFAEDGKKSPFEKGAIPIMVGESIENYLVMLPEKRRANGEMSFVSYDSTEKLQTFKDLYAFLESELKTSRALVLAAKKGGKRKPK
jgi:hypothetical protein